MKQIFLKEYNSKKGSNVDNFINMELSTETHLLPVSDVDKKINAYEEYIKEKDSSNKYRLIFTINPICSNILFNAYSEIVYKEGSNSPVVVENKKKDLSDGNGIFTGYCTDKRIGYLSLSKTDFIDDTSFSDASMDFVYHCGIDIFNNHTLRRKNFVVVNKFITGTTYSNKFNTIEDYLRDSNGNIIEEKILKLESNGNYLNGSPKKIHLYKVDTIENYKKTVNDKLSESEGWIGFLNPTSINIPNYKGYTFNKCMNKNKANEFIDMYPDRSLYSFIPKRNKYKNRMENNWDYCITYPYASYDTNSLVKYQGFNVNESNGIHCTVIDECTLSDTILGTGTTENKVIYLRTQIRNSFSVGSYVNITIFNKLSTGTYATSYSPIKISGLGYLGNDTNHIFAINLMDFYTVIRNTGSNFLDTEGHLSSNYEIRVRKYVNGIDCKYYIRKFRKLPNFKNTDVYQDGIITEEEIKSNIDKPFSSSLNRVAYGENIYSDKMAQIVFNDDIVTTGIRDNLGRELSEIYLTIVKRNKGYKEWNKGNYTADTIEFSHCFGKIDSGFDLSPEENDYNVHKIHNVDSSSVIASNPSKLETEINIDNEYFDGDIVEFSPYEIKETVLEKVYHRFNTAQRECTSSNFGNGIRYKEIITDDYDLDVDFTAQEYQLNNNSLIHLNPEGYYYQPHYRICVKEFKDELNQGEHIKIALDIIKKRSNSFTAETAVNYYLNAGDTLYFYKKYTHEKKIGKIVSVSGDNFTKIVFEVSGINDISDYLIYKPNTLMPANAYELEDGSGRYLWKDIKSDKDILPEDELYNSIFTNGAHYFQQNINFFLRRQDPTGEYGLSEKSKLDIFTGAAEGKIKEINDIEYIKENQGTIC